MRLDHLRFANEMIRAMAGNDGAGPDAEQAARLADAMEAGLSEDVVPTPAGTEASHFAQETADIFGMTEEVTFTPDRQDIERFIRFCRASGGFEVT